MAKNKTRQPAQTTRTPRPTRERVMVVGPTGKRRFAWRDKD